MGSKRYGRLVKERSLKIDLFLALLEGLFFSVGTRELESLEEKRLLFPVQLA